jgi:homoserine kinase
MAASSISIDLPKEFGDKLLPSEKVQKRLTLKIPGSTANLGPGFDTIGLALDVHSWLDFSVLLEDDPEIPLFRQCGAIARQLPDDETNLIYKIMARAVKDKSLLKRIRISVYSDIPLERGMGSSGSVIIGAIYAAARFNGENPTTEKLLADASAFESHIDNLSASLLGGLVISHRSDREIITSMIEWPENWKLLVLVPSYSVSTTKSRSVLPPDYKRADVVENLQHLALLTAAICERNPDLFKRALVDKIHEPYRLHLIPDLGNLRDALKEQPVMGSALSGAGSAMLVIAEQDNYEQILRFLKKWTAEQRAKIDIIEADVDTTGLTVISDD